MSSRIQDSPYIVPVTQIHNNKVANYNNSNSQNVAFKGGKGGSTFWRAYKKLANYMKAPSEVVNASIDCIGTGVIATAVIPISPGKRDAEDKEKKRFQAIRQPISAALKFCFQVPVTFLVWLGVDKLAFDKKIGFFKDSKIGDIVPEESYLYRKLNKDIKAAKKTGNISETCQAYYDKLAEYDKKGALYNKHVEEIKELYTEDGIAMNNELLEKELSKNKEKFVKSECIKDTKNSFINKIELPKDIKIEDKDLISKDLLKYIDKAKTPDAINARETIKRETENIQKSVNLKWYEKLGQKIGIKSSAIKDMEARCSNIKTEESVKCLKVTNPELFGDGSATAREKMFKKIKSTEAQKRYAGKKFWISLGINLVMVTISCTVLNWLHPKVKVWYDAHKQKKQDHKMEAVA